MGTGERHSHVQRRLRQRALPKAGQARRRHCNRRNQHAGNRLETPPGRGASRHDDHAPHPKSRMQEPHKRRQRRPPKRQPPTPAPDMVEADSCPGFTTSTDRSQGPNADSVELRHWREGIPASLRRRRVFTTAPDDGSGDLTRHIAPLHEGWIRPPSRRCRSRHRAPRLAFRSAWRGRSRGALRGRRAGGKPRRGQPSPGSCGLRSPR